MSYRVRTQFRAEGPVTMMARDLLRLLPEERAESVELPEDHFLHHYRDEAERVLLDGNPPFTEPARVTLDPAKMTWDGNHASGMLGSVAPLIQGRLEAVFTGEDGEVWGAVIEGGLLTECDAEITLRPRAPK